MELVNMNNFKNWIDTFIEEKDLPMEDTFTIDKNGTMNIMSYKTIYEHMLIANDKEQEQIKNMALPQLPRFQSTFWELLKTLNHMHPYP